MPDDGGHETTSGVTTIWCRNADIVCCPPQEEEKKREEEKKEKSKESTNLTQRQSWPKRIEGMAETKWMGIGAFCLCWDQWNRCV